MMNLKQDFEMAKAEKNWPKAQLLVKTLAFLGNYQGHDMNDCLSNLQSFETSDDWSGAEQLFNQMLETTGNDPLEYGRIMQEIAKNQVNSQIKN